MTNTCKGCHFAQETESKTFKNVNGRAFGVKDNYQPNIFLKVCKGCYVWTYSNGHRDNYFQDSWRILTEVL